MVLINSLNIDIETRSGVDLLTSGVYRYAESDDFEILLFGVSVNHGNVNVYDLANGEVVPDEILSALSDNNVTKWAYNANFERICLSRWLRDKHPMFFKGYGDTTDTTRNFLDPSSWKCTMVWAAYNGLPFGLEKVGTVLRLDTQKMTEGKSLIKYFCLPCKPTKTNGMRTWNLPEHDSDKWELFKKYNERDVQVELEIQQQLINYPVPDRVWDEYHLDQVINDRGILLDVDLVHNALDALSKERITKQLKEKTGLDDPNSVQQLTKYLAQNDIYVNSPANAPVQQLLKNVPSHINEVLELRSKLAKSSVSKYHAMNNVKCNDGRCRGTFQFYGTNRSGRWVGRLIQLQNLPQNHMPDLGSARGLVKKGDYEILEMLYDSIPNVLSELIRTAFIPRQGYKFIVSDFSAIEARVLAFLSGELWRVKVFKEGRDIYSESASRMFHVKVEKHGANAHLRQKGKIAELALGYGGSVGTLTAMGALDMGLSEDELPDLVTMWRNTNPNIVNYWWTINNAVINAVKYRQQQKVGVINICVNHDLLLIVLPSGRRLTYISPRIGVNQFGNPSVTYMGVDSEKNWTRIESYGSKFVENIVQAISRDILAYAMNNLSSHLIVGHVHDEVIIECEKDVPVTKICELMSKTPPWLPGIDLRAEGYECNYYQKQ